MSRLKQAYVETFKALKNDTELLDLLEIDYNNKTPQEVMANVRKQIVDGSQIDDLLEEYSTRLAIYEKNSDVVIDNVETNYLSIDIHITYDNNKIDRRALLIAERLIEILDSRHRKRRGLQPLDIGLDGLEYYTRKTETTASKTVTGWEQYTVLFRFKYLIL